MRIPVGAQQAVRTAGTAAWKAGRGPARGAFEEMARAWYDSQSAGQSGGHAGLAARMRAEYAQTPAPGTVTVEAETALARMPGLAEMIRDLGRDLASALADPQTREAALNGARVAVVAGASGGAAYAAAAVPVVGPALAPAAAILGGKAADAALDAAGRKGQGIAQDAREARDRARQGRERRRSSPDASPRAGYGS